MNKIKGRLLLYPIIFLTLLFNYQKVSSEEITITENVADKKILGENSSVEYNSVENETVYNETTEDSIIEDHIRAENITEENITNENKTENNIIETNTASESVAVNDTFVFEYEGHILEYRILTLADDNAQGTVMVVGIQDNTNLSDTLRFPASVTYFEKIYNVTLIGNSAFVSNNDIISVEIPEGVTQIGDKAFRYCRSLTNVIIGDSVTDIGESAFEGCTNLRSIKLPKNLNTIKNSAFSNCISLENIDLPEGLKIIADLAFSNCSGLKNVKLPSKTSLIAWQAFQGTNIVFWVERNTSAASYCMSRRYTYNYITNSETDKIAIDSIVINPIFQQPYPDKLQLYIGKNATFSISYYPNNSTEKAITWSSSNSVVAKVSADGTVTAVSSGITTITATVGKKTAKMTIIVNPDVPKSVKATSSGFNSIKISWNRVRNAKNYRVYRATSKSGKYTRIADVNTLYYEDTDLLDATTYYYKVKAYGFIEGAYTPSYYSSICSAKTKIGKPEFLLANYVSDQSIMLLLGYVPGANGYMIYRATSVNGTYKYITSVKSSASSYTDKSLSKGKTYYYKVKAYNYVNKTKMYSDYSKVVSASTKLPSYVTFGTSETNVYKILGRPSSKHYFVDTRTYELYYKKSHMSSSVNTASIYLKKINNEWIVVGWSNLFNGLKVSDGNETNTGYFTLGSTMDKVNKVMQTPYDFEYFYGGTTLFGDQIRTNYLRYMYGSSITFNDNMEVIGWNNINGSLKVKYGSDKPTYSQITIGTSLSEVLKALGTPDELTPSGYPLEYPKYLTYGRTTLTFDENLELAGWSTKDKLKISIGIKEATANKVKVGTSLNDVIKAMGTPDSYIVDPNHPSSLQYVIYGNKIYNFDYNRKVISIQSR